MQYFLMYNEPTYREVRGRTGTHREKINQLITLST